VWIRGGNLVKKEKAKKKEKNKTVYIDTNSQLTIIPGRHGVLEVYISTIRDLASKLLRNEQN
jgi:hypothetical protein